MAVAGVAEWMRGDVTAVQAEEGDSGEALMTRVLQFQVKATSVGEDITAVVAISAAPVVVAAGPAVPEVMRGKTTAGRAEQACNIHLMECSASTVPAAVVVATPETLAVPALVATAVGSALTVVMPHPTPVVVAVAPAEVLTTDCVEGTAHQELSSSDIR